MSSQDLNREQKRALKRMGALNDQGAPLRTARGPQAKAPNEPKVGPVTYVREVREEMRKVAWPTWPEVRRYSLIVLGTVIVFTAIVGGLDFAFGIFANWLYKD